MNKIISYFKTAKERSSIKWIVAIVVLIIVGIYYFRKVQDTSNSNPATKRLQEQLDSIVVKNKALELGRISDQHIIDSVTIRSQYIQTRIIEIPKYVEIRINSVDTFDDRQITGFLSDRYGQNP